MSDPLVVEVDESHNDVKKLVKAGCDLALTKIVMTFDGEETANTIFQSHSSPVPLSVFTLAMPEVYGLNYIMHTPTTGVKASIAGDWKPVSMGRVYTLDKNGLWETETRPGPRSTVTIFNEYQPVHVVLGIQTEDGTWNPIVVDPQQSLEDGTTGFRPLEQFCLSWLPDQASGTYVDPIDITSPEVCTCDLTDIDSKRIYFWYDTSSSQWHMQSSGPFQFEDSTK